MMAISRLNNENEFMISFLRFNTGGLDESSPYINIHGHDKSSPYRIDYYNWGVLRDKEGRRRRRNAHSWPGFPDRRFSYKVSNTAKSFNAVPNLVHPCLDIDGFGSCNCYYFLFD
ncbi:MAG TPA: hypothetical protein ENH65_06970 [Candidatus Aminicenantes bacterium]|nr:hypothetical protein [Candidatus Aminicenantes bacterium]